MNFQDKYFISWLVYVLLCLVAIAVLEEIFAIVVSIIMIPIFLFDLFEYYLNKEK